MFPQHAANALTCKQCTHVTFSTDNLDTSSVLSDAYSAYSDPDCADPDTSPSVACTGQCMLQDYVFVISSSEFHAIVVYN